LKFRCRGRSCPPPSDDNRTYVELKLNNMNIPLLLLLMIIVLM